MCSSQIYESCCTLITIHVWIINTIPLRVRNTWWTLIFKFPTVGLVMLYAYQRRISPRGIEITPVALKLLQWYLTLCHEDDNITHWKCRKIIHLWALLMLEIKSKRDWCEMLRIVKHCLYINLHHLSLSLDRSVSLSAIGVYFHIQWCYNMWSSYTKWRQWCIPCWIIIRHQARKYRYLMHRARLDESCFTFQIHYCEVAER